MTGDTPGIEQLLNQLRSEVDDVDDPQHSERLTALADRIERQIANDLTTDDQGALVSEISDELVEFEVQHPTIAGIFQHLIRLLGSIGV